MNLSLSVILTLVQFFLKNVNIEFWTIGKLVHPETE